MAVTTFTDPELDEEAIGAWLANHYEDLIRYVTEVVAELPDDPGSEALRD